jgi:hypothetical protein
LSATVYSRPRDVPWWPGALACAVVAGAALVVLSFDDGRDQGIYRLVARAVEHGGAPYRHAWDFKPPGIFFVYRLAAWMGDGPRPIRVLEVAGLIVQSGCLAALARRFWGEPGVGLIAAALAALVHAQLDFWHTAQPESFGGMLTAVALWIGTHPGLRTARLVAGGALFGAAALLKPPLGGGALLLAIWGARAARRRGRSARGLVAATLAGALAPVVACAAWFATRGALGDLADAVLGFAPKYTALGWRQEGGAARLAWRAVREWPLAFSGPVSAGLGLWLAWALAARGRGASLAAGRRGGPTLLVALVAVELAGVAAQAKFFPYHYAACVPPTALLAARGWWLCAAAASRRGLAARGLVALGALVSVLARGATRDVPGSFWERLAARASLLRPDLSSAERVALRDALASVADVDAAESRRLGAALAAAVPPDATVFIWGFEPGVYLLAERRPACRFIYNVPQRVAWAGAARPALVGALEASPPAAVVVAHGDVLPMVTGDDLDSAAALDGFPDLRRWLARTYRPYRRIGDFELWLRAPP